MPSESLKPVRMNECPDDYVMRHIETDVDVRACYPVMLALRPHLQGETDLAERLARMRSENYRLLALWRDDEVIALAGYRLQENLVYGRFLYVDDLVTAESDRGRRCGARLLDELTLIGTQTACVKLALDTALSNALAQRFYFREGLLSGAMRFSKLLTAEAR
jgi:ribosomal protein S18 acetylase RimI-like enzyme